ncbi:MAG: DHH family phosphoesterase, partial [Christensenellaceae bacterium]|nr:DHH family phosphoesterase [Christensenellaceae bacterium]
MKKQIQQIIDAVKESQRILIVGHVSPDGDCFGSMFALGMELERQGKYVRASAGEGLTDKYNFMRDYLNCCAAKDLDEEDFDLVIAVDTADDYRVGSILEPIFKKQPLKISIDHHMTNPGFSDINWVEERSATGELIYELLKEMDAPITVRTANALYAAIMTDTGNFIYSNTTPETLCLAAEL